MINIGLFLIFSYNRSCQLDAFLTSLKIHFKNWKEQNFIILYKYSDEDFLQGYLKCINKHPEFLWIMETDIKTQIDSILDSDHSEFTCMFCDDDLFKEDFDIDEKDFNTFKNNNKICCFSMRMHPNVIKCYPAGNIDSPPPKFINVNPYVWNWAELTLQKNGDYSYAMSIDGHIFRSNYIKPLLKSLPYTNVNLIEVYMSMYPPKHMPLMCCSEKSSIMNLPFNRVQTTTSNINMGINITDMNNKYLKGFQIDIEKYRGFNNISPHQEVELFWKQ
jgi:hypothetical protein